MPSTVSPGSSTREVDRLVGLAARVGLDVGRLGAEQFLGPLASQPLDHVGVLAATVVAPAGVALGVLVGQHRAHRLEHRLADEVLRGDQFQAAGLALDLAAQGVGDLGIHFTHASLHHAATSMWPIRPGESVP